MYVGSLSERVGPERVATPPLLVDSLIKLPILQITTDFHRSPAARWYSQGVRDAEICICGLWSVTTDMGLERTLQLHSPLLCLSAPKSFGMTLFVSVSSRARVHGFLILNIQDTQDLEL